MRARYSIVVSQPRLGQLLAGRAVAELRLVPEREERLVAAGLGARATASTSSAVMYARSPRRGGCANVR